MNDSHLTPPPDQEKVTPGRCLLGAAISAALGFGVYSLSKAIAVSFAHTPVTSDNPLVIRITVAVRTLKVLWPPKAKLGDSAYFSQDFAVVLQAKFIQAAFLHQGFSGTSAVAIVQAV